MTVIYHCRRLASRENKGSAVEEREMKAPLHTVRAFDRLINIPPAVAQLSKVSSLLLTYSRRVTYFSAGRHEVLRPLVYHLIYLKLDHCKY